MNDFTGKTQAYWDAAECLVRHLAKLVYLKLKNDIQGYVEENYASLDKRRISELEVKYDLNAFYTRTEDLNMENKLVRDASYEFQAADYLLDQGMSFADILKLLVPPLDKTKQVIIPESDYEKWLDNDSSVKFREEKVDITPRKLEKHAKKVKKNLAKLLHRIKKRGRSKNNTLGEGVDTIVALYTEANGMQ